MLHSTGAHGGSFKLTLTEPDLQICPGNHRWYFKNLIFPSATAPEQSQVRRCEGCVIEGISQDKIKRHGVGRLRIGIPLAQMGTVLMSLEATRPGCLKQGKFGATLFWIEASSSLEGLPASFGWINQEPSKLEYGMFELEGMF